MTEMNSSVSVEERDGIKLYTLRRGLLEAKVTSWGASLMSLFVPDSKGNVADVVLGFDTPAPYKESRLYFGAIVGRVANRIKGASFELNGHIYNTPANDGPNTNHGGEVGFDMVLWQSSELNCNQGPAVQFTYNSFDNEQGFPGDLEVKVTYRLTADLELRLDMEGYPGKKPTPVSLAGHTYWNLSGHGNGTILDHEVRLWGSSYTPVDEAYIPTGDIVSVHGTPFDFSKETSIRSRIDQVGGYDFNCVLESRQEDEDGIRLGARVMDPQSGRVLEVFTDAPGIQLYTGNFLEHTEGKDGVVYKKHSGMCLESQAFPDALHHENFPSIVVQPGEVYKHTIIYRFSNSA